MYTNQQASYLRQEFWTRFGQYMAPVPPAGTEKVNWVNYRTGVKGIVFKMDAGAQMASISIQISVADFAKRSLYYQAFVKLAPAFRKYAGEDWDWQETNTNEHGLNYSSISATKFALSVFKEADWPELISFFKKRIIGLDAFWALYKDLFEMM